MSGFKDIQSIKTIDTSQFQVLKKNGNSIKVLVIACRDVNLADIERNSIENKPGFVLNLIENAYVPPKTQRFLTKAKITFGNFGDLAKIIKRDSHWPNPKKEVDFVISFLSNHDLVKKVKQIDSKRYRIKRKKLPKITILALEAYDIGIESIRYADFKYKAFQAILSTNPNARITKQAKAFAAENGIKIYYWGDLLINLSEKWK
ncbi:MAG: hypothetical protein GQ574_11950 [Crocinitomix sp.]|nr:hypothetical protein [Crocinitomix sp.]